MIHNNTGDNSSGGVNYMITFVYFMLQSPLVLMKSSNVVQSQHYTVALTTMVLPGLVVKIYKKITIRIGAHHMNATHMEKPIMIVQNRPPMPSFTAVPALTTSSFCRFV